MSPLDDSLAVFKRSLCHKHKRNSARHAARSPVPWARTQLARLPGAPRVPSSELPCSATAVACDGAASSLLAHARWLRGAAAAVQIHSALGDLRSCACP